MAYFKFPNMTKGNDSNVVLYIIQHTLLNLVDKVNDFATYITASLLTQLAYCWETAV